jgi:formylglycine-generating enzyme required for sulfatase activity
MAGHVVEWTADRFFPEGPPTPGGRVRVPDGREDGEDAWADRTATHRLVGRGGSRVTDLKFARAAFRTSMEPWSRSANVGVRIVRSIGG